MVVHHYEKECDAKNVGLLAVFKVTLTVRVSNRFVCVCFSCSSGKLAGRIRPLRNVCCPGIP